MEVLPQFLINGIITGLFYALAAIGLTMIFGLMGVVNFAHGEFFVMGGALTFTAVNGLGLNYLLSIVIVFMIMMQFGWLFERGLLRPVRDKGPLATTLVTLGAGIFLGNTILLLFGSQPQTIPSGFSPKPLIFGDVVLTEARVFAAAAAILTIGACQVCLKYTKLGRALRATFQDPLAARLSGIEVDSMYSWVFGLGAATTALAGALLGAIFFVHNASADTATLKAFCVVILAGMGNFNATILGGLTLGIVESLWGGYVSEGFTDVISFVLIITLLLIWPNGLTGKVR